MQPKDKPYVLYVAEIIYLEISEIKKKNSNFSNKEAIDAFIGNGTYKNISSGKFHDDWLKELKKNNFIDLKTNKKIPEETIRLLKIQKDVMGNNSSSFQIFTILKIIYHLRYPKEHLIIFGECVKVTSYGAKRLNKMNLFN